jgi:hypothetical protein
VFAYTHAPRIHSGDKHFEIQDVVVPRFLSENEVPSDIAPRETRIILPFDFDAIPEERRFRDLVSAETALVAISDALSRLSIRTLLFLEHIDEILWVLPDGTKRTYLWETRPFPDRPTVRYVTVTDRDLAETWILFRRTFDVTEDGKRHSCAIDVAFLLQDGKVIPADSTELVVCFPTEKKTELGFLIQGPFKTTKARDNIAQVSEANRQMIETAAQLAADSLEDLRDLELLDVESFNALPLNRGMFENEGAEYFLPVYEAIREALRTKPLLPRYGGGFVSADRARLARRAKLTEVFSPSQLGDLFGTGPLYWLDTAITTAGMSDFHGYLASKRKSWPPSQWEREPLLAGMEVRAEDLAPKLTARFFSRQRQSWLVRFYAYLSGNYKSFSGTPFIRLASGSHVAPGDQDKPNAYLPPANATNVSQTEFPLVMRSLATQPNFRKFLRETVKLREPNRVDVIVRCLLPDYDKKDHQGDPNSGKYANALKEFSEAYRQATSADRERLVGALEKTPFIACVPAADPNESPSWSQGCLISVQVW